MMTSIVRVNGAALEVPRIHAAQRYARQMLESALFGPKRNSEWCQILVHTVAEGNHVDISFRVVVEICKWHEAQLIKKLGMYSCAYLQEDLQKIRELKQEASLLAAKLAANGHQLIAG